jgi:hypothetical protein
MPKLSLDTCNVLNRFLNVQVSDTRDGESSNADDYIEEKLLQGVLTRRLLFRHFVFY